MHMHMHISAARPAPSRPRARYGAALRPRPQLHGCACVCINTEGKSYMLRAYTFCRFEFVCTYRIVFIMGQFLSWILSSSEETVDDSRGGISTWSQQPKSSAKSVPRRDKEVYTAIDAPYTTCHIVHDKYKHSYNNSVHGYGDFVIHFSYDMRATMSISYVICLLI